MLLEGFWNKIDSRRFKYCFGMFVMRFLQILLIAAIYNPLCCCDAVLASIQEESEPVSHGCCGGPQDEAGKGSEKRHNRDDCPQRVGNGYQQASLDHLKTPDMGVQPIEFLVLESVVVLLDRPVENSSIRGIEFYGGSRGPPVIYRENCVYLI